MEPAINGVTLAHLAGPRCRSDPLSVVNDIMNYSSLCDVSKSKGCGEPRNPILLVT